MHLAFEELSIRSGDFGYGFFSGGAELDDFGEPIAIELEGTALGSTNWRLDIADLTRERIALRRKFGSTFLEQDDDYVRQHLQKWVLFTSLSEALKLQYKDEIADYLLDRWSTPAGYRVG